MERGGEVNLSEFGLLADSFRTWQPSEMGRRIEFAARDRRTLVGVRRGRHVAAGKFSV